MSVREEPSPHASGRGAQHGTPYPGQVDVSLRDYAGVLRRRFWLVASLLVGVPAASVALSLRQTPRYAASAQVFLDHTSLVASLAGLPDQAASEPADRFLLTQAAQARVPAVAALALRAANVSEESPGDLLAASSVSADPSADVLYFRVSDRDPRRASALATAYARSFTDYERTLALASLERTRRTVASRLEVLRATGSTRDPLYASLLAKEQQLRTLEVLQAGDVAVAQPAEGAVKTRPEPVRNALYGVGIGLLLGLILAFLWEAFDSHARSTAEISERLGLMLLGRVPRPKRTLGRAPLLAMLSSPGGADAEAYRMLRTSIDFANLAVGARTILVTSALRREGKSTTIANLAVAFARSGRRVTVVDLDLRRPALHRLFGVEQQPGLADVVRGRVELEDAIVRPLNADSIARLFGILGRERGKGALSLLPAGSTPIDPSEFVDMPKVAEILDRICALSDIVLVDAPPLLEVADTVSFSAKVDALIVVARPDALRRPVLNEARRVLDGCPVAKLGFVLSGVPPSFAPDSEPYTSTPLLRS